MGMVLTEEQQMLQDAAAAFTTDKAPVSKFRALRNESTAHDPDLWKEMAQLGWTGVHVQEEFGGSALGFQGLGVILEQTGRTLTPSPLLSTVAIGASALEIGGSDAQKAEHLPKIVDGSRLFALAIEEGPHHRPEQVALKADKSGTEFVLSGAKTFVIDAPIADVFIVSARTSGGTGDEAGISLFLVEKGAAGVSVTPTTMVDNRAAGTLTLDNVSVSADQLLGSDGQGFALLDQILDRARIALASEMLGSAQAAFDMTLAYLKERTQFGQLIGSFQSLQHRAAQMFSELELTRSAVTEALSAVDEGGNSVHVLASLAKARANDTLHLCAREGVQMHGGIGMTDEHDIGFYLKRAAVAETAFGDSRFHRDRYARLLGF